MNILRYYNDLSSFEVQTNENNKVILCFVQVVKSTVMSILRFYNELSDCSTVIF